MIVQGGWTQWVRAACLAVLVVPGCQDYSGLGPDWSEESRPGDQEEQTPGDRSEPGGADEPSPDGGLRDGDDWEEDGADGVEDEDWFPGDLDPGDVGPGDLDWPSDNPVKVLFLVDTSASTAVLDPDGQRIAAVREVARYFADRPNVFIALIGFNDSVRLFTDGFVHLSGEEDGLFELLQSRAIGLTDHQGALASAREMVLSDLLRYSVVDRARTRYVVVLITDGLPSPVCVRCVLSPVDDPRYEADCHPELLVRCRLDALPDFGSDNGVGQCCGGLCGTPDTGLDYDLDQRPAGSLPFLEAGHDYNDLLEIQAEIDALLALSGENVAGDVRLHTSLLSCFTEEGHSVMGACPSARSTFNLFPDCARTVMRRLAEWGGGEFQEFYSTWGMNLWWIDYAPLGD